MKPMTFLGIALALWLLLIGSVEASIVKSGDFADYWTVNTTYYQYVVREGVGEDFFYHYRDSSFNWARDFGDDYGIGTLRNSSSVLMGQSNAATTCTNTSQNSSQLTVSCSNVNAVNNYTFYETYFTVTGKPLINTNYEYRVMTHIFPSNPTSGQLQVFWNATGNKTGSFGITPWNSPGIGGMTFADSSVADEILAVSWNEAVTTSMAVSSNQSAGNPGFYIGRTASIPYANPVTVTLKVIPKNTSQSGNNQVLQPLADFKADPLYSNPSPPAGPPVPVFFLNDSFETGLPNSTYWYGNQSCCSYSMAIIDNVLGQTDALGTKVLRVTAGANDTDVSSAKRSELYTTQNPDRFWHNNQTYKVSFLVYVPDDFQTPSYSYGSGKFWIVWQMHQNKDTQIGETFDASPSLELELQNNSGTLNWAFIVRNSSIANVTSAAMTNTTIYTLTSVTKGKWTEFQIWFNLSYDGTGGYTYVWVDDTLELNRSNAPNTYNDLRGPYMKTGFYRGDNTHPDNATTFRPQSVYLDRYLVADANATYEDLDADLGGETYYVDNVLGSNSYSGTSPDFPKRTLTGLDAVWGSGEKAYLLCGENRIYRMDDDAYINTSMMQSGTASAYTEIAKYGSCNETNWPKLTSSKLMTAGQWSLYSGSATTGGVWRYSPGEGVAEFILNSDDLNNFHQGTRLRSDDSISSLNVQDEWLQNRSPSNVGDYSVYMYSVGNPVTRYGGVDVYFREYTTSGTSGSTFELWQRNYLKIHDLEIMWTDFPFNSDGHHIEFYNNVVHDFGGGQCPITSGCSGETRWGNGPQAWKGAHDWLVYNNTIYEGYDAGLTAQGTSSPSFTAYNLNFSGNTVYNCAYGFEYYYSVAGSNAINVTVDHNTFYQMGEGWYSEEREASDQTIGPTCLRVGQVVGSLGFEFTNNICYNATEYALRASSLAADIDDLDNYTLDYNYIWRDLTGGLSGVLVRWYPTGASYTTLAAYQAGSGQDANSIGGYEEPFADADGGDFRILSTSPLATAASDGGPLGAWPVVSDTAPGNITGLSSPSHTATSVYLTWTNPSELSHVVINANGVNVANTTGGSYNVTGLSKGTLYQFNLTPVGSGGLEGSNATVSVTTDANTEPVFETWIYPATVYGDTTIIGYLNASDFDGDQLTYQGAVYVDGVLNESFNGTANQTSYSNFNFRNHTGAARGQEVLFSLRLYDGSYTDYQNVSVVISNHAPIMINNTLQASLSSGNLTLQSFVAATDYENDTIDYIGWFDYSLDGSTWYTIAVITYHGAENGSLINIQNTTLTPSATYTYRTRIRPYDANYGEYLLSNYLTIDPSYITTPTITTPVTDGTVITNGFTATWTHSVSLGVQVTNYTVRLYKGNSLNVTVATGLSTNSQYINFTSLRLNNSEYTLMVLAQDGSLLANDTKTFTVVHNPSMANLTWLSVSTNDSLYGVPINFSAAASFVNGTAANIYYAVYNLNDSTFSKNYSSTPAYTPRSGDIGDYLQIRAKPSTSPNEEYMINYNLTGRTTLGTANFSFYREKTNAALNISAAEEITLEVYCDSEVTKYTITTDNQLVNLSCAYDFIKVNAVYNASSYFRFVTPTFESNMNYKVYLLDLNEDTGIERVVTINDLTGDYSEGMLLVKTFISGSEVQIISQPFDIERSVDLFLLKDSLYVIYIKNNAGSTRVLGNLIAAAAGTSTLTLPPLAFEPDESNLGGTASWDYSQSSTGAITLSYQDTLNDTEALTWVLRNSTGIVFQAGVDTFSNQTNEVIMTYQPLSNETLYSELMVQSLTYGTYNDTRIYHGTDQYAVDDEESQLMPEVWTAIYWIALCFVFVIGLSFDARTSHVGLVVTNIFLAAFIIFGLVTFGPVTAVVLALFGLVAVINFISKSRKETGGD